LIAELRFLMTDSYRLKNNPDQQSGFRFGNPESQTTERSVARNTTQIINEMVLQCEFCWKECVSGRADLYGSIVMALIQVLNRNWKKKLRLQSVD
jgi:hypothetical protein